MRALRAVRILVLPVIALALLGTQASAQGRGRGDKHDGHGVVAQQGHEGHGKRRRVSVNDAAGVARAVLREQGYDVVRIEQIREMQIVYYRRGNMGRGRGRGPIERMIIRPSAGGIIIERAPRPVLMQINVRLGY